MDKTLDKIIAIYSAPTLSGLKPACLFSCLKTHFPPLKETLAEYNRALNPKGIFLEEIFERGGRTNIMVYHEPLLDSYLQEPNIRLFFSALGYPGANREDTAAQDMIKCLKERIVAYRRFPHEIGLFLGYPLHDVVGFMENGGKNYKLSGYWKVYRDEESARALFEEYTMCRYTVCKMLKSGMTIEQILNEI